MLEQAADVLPTAAKRRRSRGGGFRVLDYGVLEDDEEDEDDGDTTVRSSVDDGGIRAFFSPK